MKLYSYVLTSDTGFAPNPLDNFCSLACCKPIIREQANVGDWVIGIGSKETIGNHMLIYAMEITEKINFNNYYHDMRFKNRVDNIYYNDGGWKQKVNPIHDKDDMEDDIKSEYVLISENYYNFGKSVVEIPIRFRKFIKGGRGHRTNFPENIKEEIISWLKENYTPGIHDKPNDYTNEIWPGNKCI